MTSFLDLHWLRTGEIDTCNNWWVDGKESYSNSKDLLVSVLELIVLLR